MQGQRKRVGCPFSVLPLIPQAPVSPESPTEGFHPIFHGSPVGFIFQEENKSKKKQEKNGNDNDSHKKIILGVHAAFVDPCFKIIEPGCGFFAASHWSAQALSHLQIVSSARLSRTVTCFVAIFFASIPVFLAASIPSEIFSFLIENLFSEDNRILCPGSCSKKHNCK